MASAISNLSISESLIQEHLDRDEDDEEEEPEVKLKDMQEDSSRGKVEGSVFMKYLLAGGNCCVVFIVFLLYILSQVMASAIDFFVSYWVNIEESRNHTEVYRNSTTDDVTITPAYEWSTETCLYIYGVGLAILFVVALARSMSFYKLAMVSSMKLHNVMFGSVINANMRFFDTNPSGRILNRFSKDIGAVDELLPKAILDSGQVSIIMFIFLLSFIPLHNYLCIYISHYIVIALVGKNIIQLSVED